MTLRLKGKVLNHINYLCAWVFCFFLFCLLYFFFLAVLYSGCHFRNISWSPAFNTLHCHNLSIKWLNLNIIQCLSVRFINANQQRNISYNWRMMLHKTGQQWYVENLVSFINIFALTYIQVIKACLFSITDWVDHQQINKTNLTVN